MKCPNCVFRFLNIFFIAFISATPAWAGINAANGFYVGLGLLGGHYRPPAKAALTSNIIPITLSWHPYVGYRINDYVAMELGFTDLANDRGESSLGPDAYRLYAFDVTNKFIYPFETGFSLFAKAGVAITHQYVYNVNTFFNSHVNETTNAILPLAGAGVSYNFTQQAAMEFSVSRAFGNSGIRDIDMVTMGFNYTF